MRTWILGGIPRMNAELEADGTHFRGNAEVPRTAVGVNLSRLHSLCEIKVAPSSSACEAAALASAVHVTEKHQWS
jgi:hypothetical protein